MMDSKLKNSLNKFSKKTKQTSDKIKLRKKKKVDITDILATHLKISNKKKYELVGLEFNSFFYSLKSIPFASMNQSFNIVRYGSSLAHLDERTFLYGGHTSKGTKDPLLLHEFDSLKNTWI